MNMNDIIKDFIIIAIGVSLALICLQFLFGAPNPFYIVASGSMAPYLNAYDIIIVQKQEPFENIKIGDVIVFKRPLGRDITIVHRVILISEDEPRTIMTKGDANTIPMPGTDFPITEQEYIGKVQHIIPLGFFNASR